jgi:uncharacterized DUF497 family protein
LNNKADENYSKYFTIAGNCSYDSDGFEDDEVIRIISARKATKQEKNYFEGE